MAYTSPTIAWRGKVAAAVDQVHQRRDAAKDVSGRITCPHCRSPLQFTIQRDGHSRGQCVGGCGIRWCQ
jgi:hypothetical protein